LTKEHDYLYDQRVNRINTKLFNLSAIVMLLVMLLSPVIGVCHDDEGCAPPAGKTASTSHDQQESPCCPDAGHHDPSHDNCSDCPCHAPLASAAITISVVTSEITNTHAEPSLSFPEVYLSLFDPPDVTV
jgi:hypothetical protein